MAVDIEGKSSVVETKDWSLISIDDIWVETSGFNLL